MVQCKVEPSTLRVLQGKAFRINITARGSPKPSIQTVNNPFAAVWHKAGEEMGRYTERLELEVPEANMGESQHHNLGTAVQIVGGREWTHSCNFRLHVTGKHIYSEANMKISKQGFGVSCQI